MSRKSGIIYIVLGISIALCGGYFYLNQVPVEDLSIVYPFDNTLFPADITAPTLIWYDSTQSDAWKVTVESQDMNYVMEIDVDLPQWTPERMLWETIKKNTSEKTAVATIRGYDVFPLGLRRIRSKGQFNFATSRDSVKAPIFFRAVTLPFEFAVHNMETIEWCIGDISTPEPPAIVLEDMPVCANCHSFSADGSTMGMDVDYANDKGSYLITETEKEIELANEKVITWSDYRREDKELTFGLLSQISPDGRYAISTVKDRSVFVPKDDLYYSQLFFPIKGILAYYDRRTKIFHELPGADDKRFVQSNPSWSPDGKYIIFARTRADTLIDVGEKVLLTQEQCKEFLEGHKEFKFDLYRIPFNNGKGGIPEPLPGASNNGKSNYFAKYSPDGKWIVFCQSENFMLLQPDSKLYIIPATGGTPREMTCNTDKMNSWHSWSPNGKWLVFSSKVFSHYTQLLLTHVDENGNDTPPILLSNLRIPEKAANIPEFVNIPASGITRIRENFIDYYSYKRMAYEKIGIDNEKAEDFLRQSIALNPDYATTHNLLGALLRQMRRLDEAEKEYQTAIQLDPRDPVYHNNLGSVYLAQEAYQDARASFEHALQLDPKNAAACEGLGDVCMIQEDLPQAQGYFERSAKYYARNADLFRKLGNVYALQGNGDRAKQMFARAQELSPQDPALYNSLGTVHLENKEFERARTVFEAAIAIDPRYAPAYEGLGEAALATGDRSTAKEYFKRSIDLDPSYPFAYTQLGKIYLAENNLTEADRVFQKAISLDSTDAETFFNSALIALERGDMMKAKRLLLRATRINPDYTDARYQLGKVHTGLEDFGSARREFEMILQTDPDNLQAMHGLGLMYLQNENFPAAEKVFRKVYQAEPGNPNVSLMLGKVLAKDTARLPEAILLYQRTLAVAPSFQGHVDLGNLYLKTGERNRALAEFENALKIQPDAKLKSYIDDLKNR
jgi:tetratricopeptide (TPR) repeat protein